MPPRPLILDLIDRHAEERPEQPVVVDGTTLLTRSDLQALAAGHAAELVAAGVRPRSRVVLCIAPGASFSVAALGVVMAGASYVPADPCADAAVLDRIRQVTDPAAWVIEAESPRAYVPESVPVVDLPKPGRDLKRVTSVNQAVAQRVAEISVTDEVYTLFTSGTTGPPKGVVVGHEALANLLSWQGEEFQVRASDRMLQRSRLLFDFSVTEIWLPLTHGGTLIYCPESIRNNPRSLLEFIGTSGITIAQFVPTVLEAVLTAAERASEEHLPQSLRAVVCNGEALSDQTRRRFYRIWRDATLWNQYGPAEATVAVTSNECRRDERPLLMTVGTPKGHNKVFVLDSRLVPVAPGEIGEVCIAGVQLASGYLGASPAEGARFVGSPESPDRLYRTGDVGRYLDTGELELLGRLDHQVKFRGVRLELEVVERFIENMDAVGRAAVRVKSFEAPDGRRRQVLIAVVSPSTIDSAKVKAACRAQLAPHSVPGLVLPVDDLRTTANGKLDFDAHLQEAAAARSATKRTSKHSPALAIVVGILKSTFGVSDLGELEDAELDSLGIDSLDRVELVVQLEAQGFAIDLDQLACPSITPRQVASACRFGAGRSGRPISTLSLVDILAGLDDAVGNGSSDTLALHASIPHLLAAGPGIDVADLRDALVTYIARLARGGITIVLPAFTTSFAASRSYHHHLSVSESGSLGMWVLDDVEDAVRSEDPMYSHVVVGPLADFPMTHARTPFGEGSVAEWLEERNAKILGLATRDFTQTHRIEHLAGAPHHAAYEPIRGVADFGRGSSKVSVSAYVRDLDYHGTGTAFAQNTAVTESLLGSTLRAVPLGTSELVIRSITCSDLRRRLLPALHEDPMALLATPKEARRSLADARRRGTGRTGGTN